MNFIIKLIKNASKPSKTLTDVDSLYKNIIFPRTHECRINYCESLIFRANEDLSFCICKRKKKKLKKLIKLAKKELKKLIDNVE